MSRISKGHSRFIILNKIISGFIHGSELIESIQFRVGTSKICLLVKMI